MPWATNLFCLSNTEFTPYLWPQGRQGRPLYHHPYPPCTWEKRPNPLRNPWNLLNRHFHHPGLLLRGLHKTSISGNQKLSWAQSKDISHLLKRSKVHKAGPKLTSRQLWQVHRGLPHLIQNFELTWKDTTIILGPIPTRSARQWILEAVQRFRDNLDTYYGLQYLPREGHRNSFQGPWLGL